jgi:signal transduction histidine kinase
MTELLSFRTKIRSGYVLSFLLLLFSYGLLFYVQQRFVSEAGGVIHGYKIVNNIQSLRAELGAAESGVRGYILTRDDRFLVPYNEAIRKIPILHGELKSLMSDSSQRQPHRLDTLHQLIETKLNILSTGLSNFLASGFEITQEMRTRRETSLRTMDSIRLYISRITATEKTLLHSREQKLSELFKRAKMMSIVSMTIVIFALVYSLITFNRQTKAREIADKRANTYRRELERNQDELKQKNIELKELKEVEKFTSTGRIARTIAHEVRNPLTNILLATDQLKEIENKSEESPILLELINRNATRINQLVSDLLDATRFTHLDFTRAEINDLLEEAMVMAQDRIELNQVSVEKNYTNETCEVFVDREKIKVALLNIIVNAVEAMEREKGVLQLKTRREGNKCIIEIRDNGKGMDEEALQKLFEPYFTSKLKGNGLGLTNTQNIILNHKGKINAYSKPGKGAMFIITLDLAEIAINAEKARD